MKKAVLPLCVCIVLAAGGCYNPTFDSGITSLSLNTDSVELTIDRGANGGTNTITDSFDFEALLRPYTSGKDLKWFLEDGTESDESNTLASQALWISHDPDRGLMYLNHERPFVNGRSRAKLAVNDLSGAPLPTTFLLECRVETTDGEVFLASAQIKIVDKTASRSADVASADATPAVQPGE